MKKRTFVVIHTGGGEYVQAVSAADALRRCVAPAGVRDLLAVFDYAIITGAHFTKPARRDAPFVAFIGAGAAMRQGTL